jgi:hypothetical protein
MTEPTDNEIDALVAAYLGDCGPQATRVYSFARAVLAKWGTLRAEKIVIPTDTMEQEFQKHYRRGYEAGKKAAAQVAETPGGDTYAEYKAWADAASQCGKKPHAELRKSWAPGQRWQARIPAFTEWFEVTTPPAWFWYTEYRRHPEDVSTTSQEADSVMEYAARLKEAAGLLEELAEYGSYSIEYDGRMIPICPECGEQEGDHRPDCAFARAKAFLAARKRGSAMTEPIKLNKIRTSELTGVALDWAIAKCEGLRLHKDALLGGVMKDGWWASGYYTDPNQWIRLGRLRYSTSWAQGGPIIEREKIQINPSISSDAWGAANPSKDQCVWVWAETPLIAAMRCFVASRLGEEVEVPDELA